MHAGGRLGRSWDWPEPLVAAMTHYPETNYQGAQSGIVNTVGLAVKLVSAVLQEAPCPEPDLRQSNLGITEENFADVFVQLTGQLVKTRAMARVLI